MSYNKCTLFDDSDGTFWFNSSFGNLFSLTFVSNVSDNYCYQVGFDWLTGWIAPTD